MSGHSDHAGALNPSHVWLGIPLADCAVRVVDALATAVVLVARNGRIAMVNRRTERLFGYSRANLVGADLDILLPNRVRTQPRVLQQQFLARLDAGPDEGGLQMCGRRADGAELPLEVRLVPLDVEGEAMILAEISDVTAQHAGEHRTEQQHHAEAGRDLRERELERSNLDLEEFAYVASHDLKAPLRAIAHLAEWISAEVRATATPAAIQYLALLDGRVRRLQMLLDGLLAYSRVDRSHIVVEDIVMADLVNEIVAEIDIPAGFAVTCESEMPTIHTHLTPLRAVLQNLIANGVKHHDRADGHVKVTVRRLGGLVEFRIADDGPGILPRFHERIFGMFQTLASRDQVESSGIGLTIVRKHIQANGGTIRVESDPPRRGTTMVFTWKEAV